MTLVDVTPLQMPSVYAPDAKEYWNPSGVASSVSHSTKREMNSFLSLFSTESFLATTPVPPQTKDTGAGHTPQSL